MKPSPNIPASKRYGESLVKNLKQIKAANAVEPAKRLDRSAVKKLPAIVLADSLPAAEAFCDTEGGGDNRKDMKRAMDA